MAAALAALVGALVGWWLRGQAQIDSCLDGGGRWNGERGYCEVVVDG